MKPAPRLEDRLAALEKKGSWTPEDEAQADAVIDSAAAVWNDHEWTDAQHVWIGHQINMPHDRWRRAINSVWARSLATKQQKRA